MIFLQMLFVSRRSPVPSGVLPFDVMWYCVLIIKRSWKLMLNSNQWSWQLWLGCVCQCFNWSWEHASESTQTCRCGTQGHSLVADLVRLNGLWSLFQTWKFHDSVAILHVSTSVLKVGQLAQAPFGGGCVQRWALGACPLSPSLWLDCASVANDCSEFD